MVHLYRLTPRPIKIARVELCGVHTAQRQTPTQIPTGFFTHHISSTCVSLGFGVGQCECPIKLRVKLTLCCSKQLNFK